MSITINLISEKSNAINKFLNNFFEKDMLTDEATYEWSYILKNPLDAINIISAIIDNSLEKDINIWISFDENFFVRITEENYNESIKYILERFSKTA